MNKINLLYSRHNVNDISPDVSPMSIPYNELTIVLNGKLEYVMEGNEITVNGGDIIFMPTGTLRVRKPSSEAIDYISFNFVSEREVELPRYFSGAIHSEVRHLIAAYDMINSIPYFETDDKNESILACIISILEDRVKKQNFNPLTLKIMEYIHQNLERKITLDDISKLTFFSAVYCDTVFKRETGKSIIDYLLDKRMEEARKLLCEGALPLMTIAEKVGFKDYNYFSRVFKARNGYTPSEYRKVMLDKNVW